jgi:hypothetical protein
MAERRPNLASSIVTIATLIHLIGVVIATACLWWFGNWEEYGSGLRLTLRILWGVWIVNAVAAVLTRVTIFGWSFRRYFRLDENGPPTQPLPVRPTRAPWYKSGKVSFSSTVILVSLIGACAIATAVMYILTDVTGEWVFWLVFKIIWSSCWVLCIATVLTRLALFGNQRSRDIEYGATTPRAPAQEVPTSPPDTRDSSEGRS